MGCITAQTIPGVMWNPRRRPEFVTEPRRTSLPGVSAAATTARVAADTPGSS
jgi:hypothetical protein